MKKLFSLIVIGLVSILLLSSQAAAAPATKTGGRPAPTVEYTGYDISYPQCGKKLPGTYYFAIVGVNGGTAATYNACLAEQLAWATQAKAGFETHQDKLQLYVNTANPAQDIIYYNWSNWPTSGDTPYGTCAGIRTNDNACSWQYGWNRSAETAVYFMNGAQQAKISTNIASYVWWLDVETMNSWQSGTTEAMARNRAAIEGFAAYYQANSARVGLYSTKSQWEQIVGTQLITGGNLVGLPNWRPSGTSLATAKANCSVSSLTSGGYISLTQYVQKNLDYNHSCQ